MPTSGGAGQQAIPKAIRAMPATRATGTGDAGQLLTQQQLPEECRSGSGWNLKAA